jgi:GNAT superfamily N-acetyltransferase
MLDSSVLTVKDLTIDNWNDFVTLMGKHGGAGGCWCMFFRGKRKEYNEKTGDGNRSRFQEIVENNQPVGVIAYHLDRPAGWCAVAPREDYEALSRSRALKKLDDIPVWSITCFFVEKSYRRHGLMAFLIRGAIDYAKNKGAQWLEAYPVIPNKEIIPPVFAYTGFYETYINLGFQEVARRTPSSPIVRYQIQ